MGPHHQYAEHGTANAATHCSAADAAAGAKEARSADHGRHDEWELRQKAQSQKGLRLSSRELRGGAGSGVEEPTPRK